MRRYRAIPLLIITALIGCTSSGAFLAVNQTVVNLEEANYELSAVNVKGESSAGYIIGLSFSSGLVTNTVAIARVAGTDALYSEALENLWKNYEQEHGEVDRKKLALTNIRYDADIINLVLYSRVKISVRADIIEFTESD